MSEEEKRPEQVPEAQTPEEPQVAVSRRQFLIGAGAGLVVGAAGAAGVIAVTSQPAKPAEQAKPAPPVEVKPEVKPAEVKKEPIAGKTLVVLNVNGRDYQVAVEPQFTLLEVMRRDLGFTGSHMGCNGSFCSNCTVLVDGVALNSCSLLAIREAGKKIVTIEGLEKDGKLHPVQQAFWDHMAYQCGFCTSGQIMRAVELLNKVKNPTEDQIRVHMSGNMCKCSAYPNILAAVKTAAKMMA